MAHLRQHARSPFWYIRKRSFDGRWTESATGLRIDSEADTHRAKRLAEKMTIKEREMWSNVRGSDFKTWVPYYIANRYRLKSPAMARRMEIAWHTLSVFLLSRAVFVPRQVRYQHGQEYLTWRMQNAVNGRKASHNTARLELKFLSQLLNEAMRLEICETNPFLQMEVPLAPQKRKKALSNEEIQRAREAVKKEAPWMHIVLEIMLWTGCRFNEASIPINQINFETDTIIMLDSKRPVNDSRRFFEIPLPTGLKSILEELRASGAQRTVELTHEKNWRFNRFLKKVTGASSHSLRVTYITRCHQSGLSERQARRLVNHSTRAVHDIYSRLSADDVREAQARVWEVPSSAVPSASPTTPVPI